MLNSFICNAKFHSDVAIWTWCKNEGVLHQNMM